MISNECLRLSMGNPYKKIKARAKLRSPNTPMLKTSLWTEERKAEDKTLKESKKDNQNRIQAEKKRSSGMRNSDWQLSKD